MKKVHVKTFFLTGAFLIALSGCITIGSPFDSDDFSWITRNKTTKDDVYDELGEPFRTGVDSGKQTWTYGYYKYTLFGSTRTKDIIIYFNNNGTVDSYVFNTGFPDEKEKWQNR